MEYKDKNKTTFCQSNKCSCAVLFLVAAGIAIFVCVTFLSPGVRYKREQTDSLEWWQTTIIYQIYPRSFQDSDSDGVGDLNGIVSRLHHFNEINVEAIWLSPFFESPMRDFGYDISNYTAVDSMFGTMDDFKTLISKAHEKGIKVIIDFVPNHTSNESVWFDKSRNAKPGKPYSDYYVWNNGKTVSGKREPPNNWQSVFDGPAWTFDDVRQEYFYHAFLASQPDLNYRNEDVLDEMDAVLRFWLEKGIDGIRIDAIPHLFELENQSIDEPAGQNNGFNPDLHKYTKNQPEIFDVVKRWRRVLDQYEAKDGVPRFLLGETVGIPHEARMEYYKAGALPFFFDLIAANSNCSVIPQCFLDVIKKGLNLNDGQWPNFVIGNHDNKRIADRIGQEYVDVMNMLLLTLPGTPTTYYGEELGMRGGDYTGLRPKDPYAVTSNDIGKSRDPERNPMQWDASRNAGFTNGTHPWLPINSDYKLVNVEVEKKSKTSSLSLYTSLAKLRQASAFQNGYTVLPVQSIDNILVYLRQGDTETYAVAVNLGNAKDSINIKERVSKGVIALATDGRTAGDIDTAHIVLERGEGVIIRQV